MGGVEVVILRELKIGHGVASYEGSPCPIILLVTCPLANFKLG